MSTPLNADYGALIDAGGDIASWLEALAQDLGEEDISTAVEISKALRRWDALAHNGSGGAPR
jgi:hypothetical protein